MKKILSILLGIGLFLVSSSLAMENPEGRLTQLIKNYVVNKYPDWSGLEVRITFKDTDPAFAKLTAVENAAQLKISSTYKYFRPLGNVVFPIQVKTNKRTEKIFVHAKVEIFKNIVVASHIIKRGKTITPSDLKIELKDIALFPQKYFTKIDSICSSEAKTVIPAKSTIFTWMLKKIPLIRHGDRVTIQVVSEGIIIKAKGKALGDGSMGDRINVQRDDSKKPLNGKIISASDVEVQL